MPARNTYFATPYALVIIANGQQQTRYGHAFFVFIAPWRLIITYAIDTPAVFAESGPATLNGVINIERVIDAHVRHIACCHAKQRRFKARQNNGIWHGMSITTTANWQANQALSQRTVVQVGSWHNAEMPFICCQPVTATQFSSPPDTVYAACFLH